MTLPDQITTPPSADLLAIARRLGVKQANCHSCDSGYADSDGSEGSSLYCGMVCSCHKTPETYLEDCGVDVETEKACWRPDFWKTQAPEIDALIDGTEESMDRAFAEWRRLMDSLFPDDSP